MTVRIAVVGSADVDLVVRADRNPGPGETALPSLPTPDEVERADR